MHISSYSYVNLLNINDKYIILLLLWRDPSYVPQQFSLDRQEREVQRLLQSWFKTTCIVFNNICNICKPEEGWYGQLKYCYKNNTRCFKSALQ